MDNKELHNLEEVNNLKIEEGRKLFSASHEEIIRGATTDIYFIKTREILREMEQEDTEVVAEIFANGSGVFAGIKESLNLLGDKDVKVWALEEGSKMEKKEVVMRVEGAYNDFGIFETSILGILASSSGWATAASKCKQAAGEKPMLCFGARHLHPSSAPVMERSAIIGGADGASCILGAKLAGKEPSGTVPHALMLIIGDTLEVAKGYHEIMPAGAARIMLVDTFKDEAEETLRLASQLEENLHGVRLDTPSERGGVTPALVKEIRARLNQAGFNEVNIFASGGLTPARIIELKEAGADGFGVGSYISGARSINMTMDIKEVAGTPVAKRGRIPGQTDSERLKRML